jgi:HAD superfamily hydrolase (TIGR01509 family)
MPLEALIFDVDGTLADTEEGHRTAFNLAFDRLRLGWKWDRDEYRHLLTVTGGKERMAYYVRRLQVGERERARLHEQIPLIHAEKTRFYAAMAGDGGIPLRPGVARLMAEARDAGLKLAIASTTTRANIDALLRATLGADSIRMFDAIACGDQAAQKKPAPDVFRLALRQIDCEADHAVAFEDSSNGLRAAVGAGLATVVTPTFWSEGCDFATAALVLPHLGDPWQPLANEPGGRLRAAAWVTLPELQRLVDPR